MERTYPTSPQLKHSPVIFLGWGQSRAKWPSSPQLSGVRTSTVLQDCRYLLAASATFTTLTAAEAISSVEAAATAEVAAEGSVTVGGAVGSTTIPVVREAVGVAGALPAITTTIYLRGYVLAEIPKARVLGGGGGGTAT